MDNTDHDRARAPAPGTPSKQDQGRRLGRRSVLGLAATGAGAATLCATDAWAGHEPPQPTPDRPPPAAGLFSHEETRLAFRNHRMHLEFLDQPITPAELGGYIDGFVTLLPADDGSLAWSTFLGGAEADRANAVTIGTGTISAVERTLSPDFPIAAPIQPHCTKRLRRLPRDVQLMGCPDVDGPRAAPPRPPAAAGDGQAGGKLAPDVNSPAQGTSSGRPMIWVLVVDDHPLVRDAITNLLAATGDIHLVGHCADGGEVAAAVQQLPPAVVPLQPSRSR